MKIRRLYATLPAILLLAASFVGQTKPGDATVDVPFSFIVAKQKLPAGHYTVTTVSDGVIRVHGVESQGILVPVHSVEGPVLQGSGKLVFHRYADTYFLSEVWIPGTHIGRQAFRSKAEKEMAAGRTESEVAVLTTPQ